MLDSIGNLFDEEEADDKRKHDVDNLYRPRMLYTHFNVGVVRGRESVMLRVFWQAPCNVRKNLAAYKGPQSDRAHRGVLDGVAP